jgi:LysR family carnitine catabolism transcriptional activator
MDLRRLEHFLAVVDHGGFTAAARQVSASQPGLSLAVKELELELGVPLFERLGRRLLLTSAGEALVGPARQALRDVETGRAAVAAVSGLGAGTLALASLPTLAADPMAELVGRFRQQYPGLFVDLSAPEDTSDLVAMVRDGRCEVGLSEAGDLPEDLIGRDIGKQALLLILPPGIALGPHPGSTDPARVGTGAPMLALADIDIPFIAAPIGTSTRRLLDEGFTAAGANPHVVVVTAQRDAILPLVLAGAGAALVPEPIAAVAAALGATVVRPTPPVERRIALIHRRGPLAPAAARFVELATAAST